MKLRILLEADDTMCTGYATVVWGFVPGTIATNAARDLGQCFGAHLSPRDASDELDAFLFQAAGLEPSRYGAQRHGAVAIPPSLRSPRSLPLYFPRRGCFFVSLCISMAVYDVRINRVYELFLSDFESCGNAHISRNYCQLGPP